MVAEMSLICVNHGRSPSQSPRICALGIGLYRRNFAADDPRWLWRPGSPSPSTSLATTAKPSSPLLRPERLAGSRHSNCVRLVRCSDRCDGFLMTSSDPCTGLPLFR